MMERASRVCVDAEDVTQIVLEARASLSTEVRTDLERRCAGSGCRWQSCTAIFFHDACESSLDLGADFDIPHPQNADEHLVTSSRCTSPAKAPPPSIGEESFSL